TKPGETIVFTVMGGTVDDLSQMVAGEATFRKGDKVLVFLEERGNGTMGVIGLSQGKYAIEQLPGSDIEIAAPDLSDLTLAEVDSTQPGKQTVTAIDVPAHVEPQPLDDLVDTIRARLKQD